MKTIIDKVPKLTFLCFYFGTILQIATSQIIIIPPIILFSYCKPDSVNGTVGNRFINSIELGSISNLNTGANPGPSYCNYTGTHSTFLYKDSSYTIKVTGGPTYTNMRYAVWIDYNHDYDFTDTGEKLGEILATSANQILSFPFTVPSASITGATRLRVRCVYNTTTGISPCSTYNYGETEDYTINIENLNVFRRIGTGMISCRNSAVRWADIDSDHDLDISISGNKGPYFNNFVPDNKLYFNYGNDSVHFKSNLPSVGNGEIKWCDFDKDGNVDLLFAGSYKIGSTTYTHAGISLFDSVGVIDSCYFSPVNGFTGVSNATADWGDIDNDGDYDVIIAGYNPATEKPETHLYRNNNGSFELTNQVFPGIQNGKVGFIDYDLDGDLDLLITGTDINQNTLTVLFNNVDGVFEVSNHPFENMDISDFDWGDINKDGYPDLLITGRNGISSQTIIYYNDSAKSFHSSRLTIPMYFNGKGLLCDLDNDGDLDILISGVGGTYDTYSNPIYLNNGDGTFSPSAFKMNKCGGNIDVGDLDGDYDADFVINGYGKKTVELYGVQLSLFKKERTVRNQRPTTPTVLASSVQGQSVRLSWTRGTDNSTSSNSLTYNIYIGTSKSQANVVAPNAYINDGIRKISGKGYIRSNFWQLKNLTPGKYYWSVQSIDNSFASSYFAPVDSFEIMPRYSTHENSTSSNYWNPVFYFDCDHDNDMDVCTRLDNASGSRVMIIENKSTENLSLIDTASLHFPNCQYLEYLVPNDYNNDNKIDLMLAGLNIGAEDSLAFLYKFSSKFNYEPVTINNIPKLNYGFILWSDLDNDGAQDIIMSGETVNLGIHDKPVTYIFKNMKNGTFVRQNHNITNLMNSRATICDFDKDMDADIIIYGRDSINSPHTYLFLNNGNFNFTRKILPGMNYWRHYDTYNIMSGDFNKDGLPDLLVAAKDSFDNQYARVFINDSLDFVPQNLPLRSQNNMAVYWADYDFDGDLDIFVYRIDGNDAVHLYINNNGIMDEVVYDFPSYTYQFFPFMVADLDKQNGLDFLISLSSNKLVQYNDNWGSNSRLATPILRKKDPLIILPRINLNLIRMHQSYAQEGSNIILFWSKLYNPGYTYNLCVGTTKTNTNIISPMADLSTGYRYVLQPGNVFQNDAWRIKNLPLGKYYWRVQAVDLAYNGGNWSAVDSFTVAAIDPDFSSTEVCYGNVTKFTDLSTSSLPIVKRKWIFEPDMTSDLQNPSHTFSRSGSFSVTLWLYSSDGDSVVISKQVTVLPAPKAAFKVSPVCLGSVSQFINQSDTGTVNVTSWLWQFGNGETSIIRGNVNHTYVKTDTAYLIIQASNGCASVDTQAVLVGIYPEVTLFLGQNETNKLCTGDSALVYIDPYNPSLKYTWKKDDNPISNPKRSSLYVNSTGDYSVTAEDPYAGCAKHSNIQSFKVTDPPARPVITLTKGDTVKCPDESVTISITNYSNAYSYNWFRNGIPLEGQTSSALIGPLSDGEYETKASVGRCDAISDRIAITNKTAPTKPEIYVNNGPSNYYMVCSNTKADSYHWYYNGNVVSGASKYYYLAGNLLGKYTVEIEEKGKDCTIKSDEIAIPLVQTDVQTTSDKAQLNIFPNPASEFANIVFSGNFYGKLQLTITDVLGQKVLAQSFDKSDFKFRLTLSLENLTNGLYLINIQLEHERISKILIIR